MPASNIVERVDVLSIVIPEGRQRKDLGDLSSLVESIRRLGLLNPPVVTRELVLVAGERRLTAWRMLHTDESLLGNQGYATIPVHFLDQLSPVELRVVELDENIRRQDITWQEQAQAVSEIHKILCEQNAGWTLTATAQRIGLASASVSRYLTIMNEATESPKVLLAPTISSAMATVKRVNDRKQANADNILSDLVRTGLDLSGLGIESEGEAELDFGGTPEGLDLITSPSIVPAVESILNDDCVKFMAGYRGDRFNLIHCDFPYGINYDGWDKSAEYQGDYADTPEVYWNLLENLARFWDNIAAPSSHFIFWYSMRYHHETMAFIEQKIPQLTIDEFPFIWLKSDNKGTVPDPNRGPRRVYETALYGYTGDRKIIKPVANAYAAPTQRSSSIHISEKPEPVLRHFMSMLVDESTTLFDPTCGSGSSLRAAESLGASRVLGIEKDEGYAIAARKALDAARILNSNIEGSL